MKTLHLSVLVGTVVLLLLVPSATGAGTAREEPTVALKVLTFNVQFREPLADLVDPQWPNTSERAQAIGRAISTYDLIALQEVFHHGRGQEIIAAAEHAAAQSGVPSQLPSGRMFAVATDPVPPTLSQQASCLTRGVHYLTQAFHSLRNAVTQDSQQIQPMTNSGLLVLSRYPILSANFYTYQARAGIDAWAKKGVLHVVVARSNQHSSSDTLDVFVTHLQAWPCVPARATPPSRRTGGLHPHHPQR